jgi:rod shape determining protein RodA
MVLNVLPVTGVTLPLMSYGGTSALTILIATGLVLNIDVRRTVFKRSVEHRGVKSWRIM